MEIQLLQLVHSIAKTLAKETNKKFNPALLGGDLGKVLFFFEYASLSKEKKYLDLCAEYIERALDILETEELHLSFCEGYRVFIGV